MTIKAVESALVDTNVLLCATDRSRHRHSEARDLFRTSRAGGYTLALSGQIVREYLVVATRPAEVNGLGMNCADALHNISRIATRAIYCEETEAVSARLRALIGIYSLSGKRIHDANVVATMAEHDIGWLITENKPDFEVFREIQTLDLGEWSEVP